MLTAFKKHNHAIYISLLLVVSASVYLPYYGQPKAMFWDENYHIASAQKYLNQTMYMEPHPPLGKLLMAASDALLGLNKDVDRSNFSNTDYLKGDNIPANLNYYGYRLPSTLLMSLSVLFFFGIVRLVTNNLHVAAAFSCFVIFDNALVVQARSAMLEGIQLFFILGAIYFFVRSVVKHSQGLPMTLRDYGVVGLFVGLAVSVKINGLILLLLFVVMFVVDMWDKIKVCEFKPIAQRLILSASSSVVSIVFVVLSVFYIHIELGKNLATHTSYSASDEYKQHIINNDPFSLSTFYGALKDNFTYAANYANGVPRLDICKDGENGSPAFAWPLGVKAINYRWNKNTVDGVTRIQYHSLVANPIIWFSVLIGIFLSLGLVVSRYVYDNDVKDKTLFNWICVFSGLYLSYMIVMLGVERVMYLYHYLVPLIFGMINLALIFSYIFRDALNSRKKHVYLNLSGVVLLAVGVFFVLAPFTYSWEISPEGLDLRNWFAFGLLGGVS